MRASFVTGHILNIDGGVPGQVMATSISVREGAGAPKPVVNGGERRAQRAMSVQLTGRSVDGR